MNDDDLTSLHELANSHLDDDNGPDTRATAELHAMVDAFRAVRSALTTVAPAPVAAREAALAAALAAFDEQQASAGDTAPPAAAPVISLAARRRWPSKVMGIAAAVAAVGVIGVGATQLGGGNDKSSSTESAEKAQMDAVGGGDVQIENAAESVPAMAPSVTIGSINSAGSVATVINTPAELAALPELTMFADPAAAPGDTAGGGTSYNDVQRIISSNSAAVACLSDTQVYLADIFYNGTFGIAARDTVTGVTSAIADDCTVLVSVAP